MNYKGMTNQEKLDSLIYNANEKDDEVIMGINKRLYDDLKESLIILDILKNHLLCTALLHVISSDLKTEFGNYIYLTKISPEEKDYKLLVEWLTDGKKE